MSAITGASQQQRLQLLLSCTSSEQDDPKTSSSILDFLNQEQKCWNSASPIPEDDCASEEVDIEGIFDEINRLSGKIHESRSVDEILQEAETLILSQAPIQLKCTDVKWPPDTPDAIAKSVVPGPVTNNQHEDDDDDGGEKDSFHSLREIIAVPQSRSESHLSKILIPATTESFEAIMPAPAASAPMTAFDDIPLHIHPQPGSMSSSIYSPTNSYARERALESEITSLQDKLKDTEERYHAIRIKYDALRLQYRDVREQQTSVQDETEKLRRDVQHLNDCASILRNEIHVARVDREEATRLQGVLQAELDSCRRERKRFSDQTERDSKTILDLQRQCREMEKILTRKHPDSVSALIVAAKGMPPAPSQESIEASRRVLEQRIVQLEKDAVDQDAKAQKILANVQTKFSAIQAKYETHIADLETQVLSLQDINSTLNKKIVSLADTLEGQQMRHEELEAKIASQAERTTTAVSVKSPMTTRGTQTVAKSSNLPRAVSASTLSSKAQNGTDNDSAHLMATIRGMRVDLAIKEKALQRLTRELDECKKTIRKLKEMSCKMPVSSNSSTNKKPYDPLQFTEKVDNPALLKEAHHKLKLLEFDYKTLHDKRLQDLKTLQAAHERELSSCQETVRILQQRLAEGDEAQKRRRVPVDYYALKAKVTNLEMRHSEREDRLHMLVEALSKGRLSGIIDDALLKSTGRESDNGSESTVSPNSD